MYGVITGLQIYVDKISVTEKDRVRKLFNAYDVIYLFEKRIDK